MDRKLSNKDWMRILADVRSLIRPDTARDTHPAAGSQSDAKESKYAA